MEHNHSDRSTHYRKNSLSLLGAVSLGTGVMIGAGILTLTGQMAEFAGAYFPLAFFIAAIVTAVSAYSYVKLSNAYPSAGGIAMFLEKAYGRGVVTAVCALLMYLSMVINESLVARTFGNYTVQLFNLEPNSWVIPVLAVAVLFFAFFINILSNSFIQTFSFFMAFIKIGGLALLAAGGLLASGVNFNYISNGSEDTGIGGFLAAVALGVLAYKGFTTITNSGGEINNPHKNVGRAIIISIAICFVLYLLVSLAVSSNLSISEIIQAKDYSLAQAAKPAFGEVGLWITVTFAVIATISGLIASVFAVSRMLAMLTEMKLVPHSHFRMPGSIQKHTLVYTIVIAMLLTIFFDVSRIASLGAIFYLTMDIAVHWGIFSRLRQEVNANGYLLMSAIALDLLVLTAFIIEKLKTDMLVVYIALACILFVIIGERLFLRKRPVG